MHTSHTRIEIIEREFDEKRKMRIYKIFNIPRITFANAVYGMYSTARQLRMLVMLPFEANCMCVRPRTVCV